MPRIIMNRGFIARWTRMPHSTGRLSASVSSHHSLSSAAFITNIAESDFRHAQARKVHGWAAGRFYGDEAQKRPFYGHRIGYRSRPTIRPLPAPLVVAFDHGLRC